MKKLIASAVVALGSLSVFAQGLVDFQEAAFKIQTNSTVYIFGGGVSGSGSSGQITATVGGFYFYTLLMLADPTGSTGTAGISTNPLVQGNWVWTGAYGTNANGINAGGINAGGVSPGIQINGWAGGTTNYFMVVGWSATEAGANWASVSNELATGIWNDNSPSGVFGVSQIGYAASANSPNPGTALFGAGSGQIGAFTLYAVAPVPEPGTLALAGLGGLSLLLFRRPGASKHSKDGRK